MKSIKAKIILLMLLLLVIFMFILFIRQYSLSYEGFILQSKNVSEDTINLIHKEYLDDIANIIIESNKISQYTIYDTTGTGRFNGEVIAFAGDSRIVFGDGAIIYDGQIIHYSIYSKSGYYDLILHYPVIDNPHLIITNLNMKAFNLVKRNNQNTFGLPSPGFSSTVEGFWQHDVNLMLISAIMLKSSATLFSVYIAKIVFIFILIISIAYNIYMFLKLKILKSTPQKLLIDNNLY